MSEQLSQYFAPRSVLFAPGNRADLVAKLPRSKPDAVIIDLEDAVPNSIEAKANARPIAQQAAKELRQNAPDLAVFLRVNALHSPYFQEDLAVLFPDLAGVVVPKIESQADTELLAKVLTEQQINLPVMAGLETGAGIWNALEIMQASNIHWAYFGAEDYTTDLGGQRTKDNTEVLYARSKIALAARLAGIPALDIVVTRLKDEEAFRADAQQGRALGYDGKLCIHPAQVALSHEYFGPTDTDAQRAKALLQAAAEAEALGHGAFSFDGQMVDEPMLVKARAILQARGEQA